jgi:hypothetical protein
MFKLRNPDLGWPTILFASDLGVSYDVGTLVLKMRPSLVNQDG